MVTVQTITRDYEMLEGQRKKKEDDMSAEGSLSTLQSVMSSLKLLATLAHQNYYDQDQDRCTCNQC